MDVLRIMNSANNAQRMNHSSQHEESDGNMLFFSSQWWILGPGMQWQQWARIEDEGKVGIYDPNGEVILKARHSNRFKAASSLKRQGFRKLSRKQAKELCPPQVTRGHRCASRTSRPRLDILAQS